ncbi:MAG: hypothetical protein P0Y59_06945 [Candidatus Sphingomonas phytovorans]|nr:hypothetical protein [Sphingomonas sp.]WEK01410.1 MAG: hypothetical protein P0Y59_06945 [Sphingomonas sp.]
MRGRIESVEPPVDPALLAIPQPEMTLAESPEVATLHRLAERCRRLATTVGDRHTVETLITMAQEYEAQADLADTSH